MTILIKANDKIAFTEEPDLTEEGNPEEILHKALKKEIKEILERKKFEGALKEYLILDEFGLDLAEKSVD